MSINLPEPQIVLDERTCSRCGSFFLVIGRRTLCDTCRKPERTAKDKYSDIKEGVALSPREIQVGDLIAYEGIANKEVAFRLHLKEGYVKIIISHMLKKTGAGNRTQLGIWIVNERKG